MTSSFALLGFFFEALFIRRSLYWNSAAFDCKVALLDCLRNLVKMLSAKLMLTSINVDCSIFFLVEFPILASVFFSVFINDVSAGLQCILSSQVIQN